MAIIQLRGDDLDVHIAPVTTHPMILIAHTASAIAHTAPVRAHIEAVKFHTVTATAHTASVTLHIDATTVHIDDVTANTASVAINFLFEPFATSYEKNLKQFKQSFRKPGKLLFHFFLVFLNPVNFFNGDFFLETW